MNREQLISQTFVELTGTLVAEFDAVDVMHTLAERAVELLEVDAAAIIVSDQRENDLQLIASTSHEARIIELLALQNDEGPCLDCYKTGEPVVNVSKGEAADRWPRFTAAAIDAEFQSIHALPLHLRHRVIGAMSLFCSASATLSDADISLGQALCDVATISLLQERAVRHNELLAEQLQTALNSRIVIEQAKGWLAAHTNIDVEMAFTLMRGYSRRTRQPLTSVAHSVIDGSLDPKMLLDPSH